MMLFQSFMRRRTIIFIVVPGLLVLLWILSRPASGYTRLELADPETGSRFASFVLGDGEPVVLTWRNSIWGLDVTEAFVAKGGLLIQTEVTFAHPDGSPPPHVTPQEVDDLYHTGGAFSAKGLARPLHRVVYRIGEIGKPRMRVQDRVIEFKPLVGFGGRVVLTVCKPRVYETISTIL
jgi:hypothetical protein